MVAMRRFLLVHYGEIGLKKSNQDYFVEKLRLDLKLRLQQRFKHNFSIVHTLGRILVRLPEDFSDEQEAEYSEIVGRIFGIKNFRFVYEGGREVAQLTQDIYDRLPKFEEGLPANFKVQVKRSMPMEMKSVDMERVIGGGLVERGFRVPVKLLRPEFTVDIEFFNGHGYFGYHTYRGVGGMAPLSQGKLVALLSAGIDSPVASYLMMRRGARVVLAHFHGYPYTDIEEMENVKKLAKILSGYQFDTKLYLLPFAQVQKAIATNLEIPGKVRTILYRRLMLKIAQEVARKERANGLVTGDVFGQVASQTPENIVSIHDATTIPLLQPLIAYDKEEIVKLAEKIGTFEISKLPCKDTCTMFAPKKAEIKSRVDDIRLFEQQVDCEFWVKKVLSEAETVIY